MIFFLISTENGFLHFMKIVSIRDSFHEVSKPVFFSVKNIEKYFNMSSAENFTQSASVKRRDCVPGELMLSPSRWHFGVCRRPR